MTNPDTTSVFIKLKHIFLTLTHDTTTIQLLFLLNLNHTRMGSVSGFQYTTSVFIKLKQNNGFGIKFLYIDTTSVFIKLKQTFYFHSKHLKSIQLLFLLNLNP